MKWRYVAVSILAVMFLPFVQGDISDPAVSWCIPPCVVDLEVVTGAPINVTRESANFQGNLISLGNNSEANVSFEWGATPALGFQTEDQERIVTGTFSQLVLGLQPGLDYYVRARAVGPNGTDVGLIRSFTTEEIVPTELIINIAILVAGITAFIIAIVIGFWIREGAPLVIGGFIGVSLGLWMIFTFTLFVGLSFIGLGILFAYIGVVNIHES